MIRDRAKIATIPDSAAPGRPGVIAASLDECPLAEAARPPGVFFLRSSNGQSVARVGPIDEWH